MKKAAGISVATMLVAMLGNAAQAQSANQTSKGAVDGFDVTAYDVKLTPDLASKTVNGTETIRLCIGDRDIEALLFSPNALTVSGAKINGRSAAVTSDDKGISFKPARPLKRGSRITLTFAFAGTPKRGVNAVPGGLYSSYFACDWMICRQDTPGDKAHLTLALTIPNDMTSLAPGIFTRSKRASDNSTQHIWKTERPYSPYIYGFAVGPFTQSEVKAHGKTLRYINATGTAQDLPHKFAATPDMIAFLSDKAGLPLPVSTYAQLLVPEWEAQEAASYSLIGVKALDADLATPDKEWILVHELAHQWWGNLITSANWREFWLNEGLATYMTAAWKEHRYGKAAYDAELDGARKRLAAARDKGFDKPLAWDGKYPSLGLRRAVQYSKGALFLDHLRGVMGDAAFWAGIKTYTKAHAGGTVTSADFQRAMQSATQRDLTPEFKMWVYG